MNKNIQTLVEMYQGLSEWEQILFIDFLSDLRKWIIDPSKTQKKTHLSPYFDESIQEIKEWLQDKKLQKFFEEMREIMSQEDIPTDKNSWIFILNKERQFFPKEVKKHYVILEKEELENIYDFRKIILKGFVKYEFIEIYVSKNKKLQDFFTDYINEITELNDKNRRVLASVENIKDDHSRNHLKLLQTDFWTERVQKVFEYFFNDIEIINYFCDKKDLEDLYCLITWKEVEKDYVEFFPNEAILKYKWKKSKPFKKEKDPYKMLSYIFEQDRDIGIEKQDIYFAMEETNSTELFYENIEKINALKTTVNRKFKSDFQTKENFLVFKGSLLYRKK